MPSTEMVAKTTKKRESDEILPVEQADTTSAEDVLLETDALLDEIDKVLDQNAIKTLAAQVDELDADKPYTLAMAMREGSTVTDQAIGSWTGQEGQTCALSAAMLAVRARGLA